MSEQPTSTTDPHEITEPAIAAAKKVLGMELAGSDKKEFRIGSDSFIHEHGTFEFRIVEPSLVDEIADMRPKLKAKAGELEKSGSPSYGRLFRYDESTLIEFYVDGPSFGGSSPLSIGVFETDGTQEDVNVIQDPAAKMARVYFGFGYQKLEAEKRKGYAIDTQGYDDLQEAQAAAAHALTILQDISTAQS